MTALDSAPPRVTIGSKTFTTEDQVRFARLSWDSNPMHMDSVAARRLLNGRPVVHGVNVLLTALELYSLSQPSAYRRVRADFRHAISVGDTVSFGYVRAVDSTVITASVGTIECAVFRLSSAPATRSTRTLAQHAPAGDLRIDRLASPLDEPAREQLHRAYSVSCTGDQAIAQEYPGLVSSIGMPFVGALGRLSYIVGMVSPGLHSMFNSIDVSITPAEAPSRLFFSLTHYDPRFHLYRIAVTEGPVVGELRALLRPSPVAQPTFADVAPQVARREFAGIRSVVIGGSRGLGELTAKILAAGGGLVTITYAAGEDDARRVAAEIDAGGVECCGVQRFDVREAPSPEVQMELRQAHCVYYFATPTITLNKHSVFEEALHSSFFSFYVRAFLELCVQLQRLRTESVEVFYPSTVFVADRPRGFTEYAIAKAAAEVLIGDLNRSLGHLRIVAPRLPRLGTDQTNSFFREDSDSAMDVLLPLVRQICQRARDARSPRATAS